ncbi:MAG: hypothetical protein ABH832_02790 [bacterium]
MKHITKKKKILAILILLIVAINIGLAVVLFKIYSIKNASEISSLKQISELVLIKHTDKVFSIRLPDKKIQEILGKWNHLFVNPNEIIVFGLPENSTDTQAMYHFNNEIIRHRNISSLPGLIGEINVDAGKMYLLFHGLEQNSKTKTQQYFCASKIYSPDDFKKCEKITDILDDNGYQDKAETFESFWDPNYKGILIIKEIDKQRRIFSYNMTSTELKLIDESQISTKTNEIEISNFYGFVTLTDNKNNIKRRALIPSAKKIIILDEKRVLAIKKEKIYLIDLDVHKQIELIDIPNRPYILTTSFDFYNSAGDIRP